MITHFKTHMPDKQRRFEMLMVMSLFVGNLKDYQAKHFNQDGGIGQLMDEPPVSSYRRGHQLERSGNHEPLGEIMSCK